MITFDFTAFDFAPLALMVKALAAIVGVSFVLAVAAAWKDHSFQLSELDGFINDDLVPALVILTTETIGILTSSESFQLLAVGGAATFAAARLPGIYANFKALIQPVVKLP